MMANTPAGHRRQRGGKCALGVAPGTILISAATQQLVEEEVQAAAESTLASDGSPLPVPVYTVQGLVQPRAGVAGRGRRHRTPFVGRERELALLHGRLAQASQGQGQVVGIMGEAGIGKSRLLEAFRRSLTEQPVTSYIGHCLPYGQTTPYLPVRDLLRQRCSIPETDDVAVVTTKVHQCLRETGLTPEDEAPWLLQLLDVPGEVTHLALLDSQARKTHTFALLHHVFLHACRRQPLILAVENLQWIDATSEAWLAALVERLAGASLLLLVSYRPGYRPPWLEQSLATQVALPGLLPQESLTVVHSVPGPGRLPYAWPITPCGGKCGTRPSYTADRQGRRPWRGRPTGRRWPILSRRIADAVALLTKALKQSTAMARARNQVPCHLALGEALTLAGRLQEAQALAEQALTLARQHREGGLQAYALHLIADIEARRKPTEHELAEAYFRKAFALAEALGMRPL